MSATLDELRQLDHLELNRLIATTWPRDWEPGEQSAVEAMLDAAPDAPIEVMPPLRRAA